MMMSSNHFDHSTATRSSGLMSNNNKLVIVLAVALGCFTILFPKIFYPMFQGSMSTKSRPPDDGLPSVHPSFRVPLKRAGQLNSEKSYPNAQFMNKENFRFPDAMTFGRPNLMEKRNSNHNKQTNSNQDSGFMGLFMPIYTAIIVLLFVYTLVKLMSRKNGDMNLEEENNLDKKLYPNLKMDPEYRKFLLQEKYDQHGRSLDSLRKKKLSSLIKNESTEIINLKTKLRDTELQLQKLVEQFHSFNKGFIDTALNQANRACNCSECSQPIEDDDDEDIQSDDDQREESSRSINQTNQQEAKNIETNQQAATSKSTIGHLNNSNAELSKAAEQQLEKEYKKHNVGVDVIELKNDQTNSSPMSNIINNPMNGLAKNMQAKKNTNGHQNSQMNKPTINATSENELISQRNLNGDTAANLNESNNQSSFSIGAYNDPKTQHNGINQFDFCDLCNCPNTVPMTSNDEPNSVIDRQRRIAFYNHHHANTKVNETHYVDDAYANGSDFVDNISGQNHGSTRYYARSNYVDRPNYVDCRSNYVKRPDYGEETNYTGDLGYTNGSGNYEPQYEARYECNYVDDTNYLDEANYRAQAHYVDELTNEHFDDLIEQSKSLNQEMSELETELFDYHEYEYYENGEDYLYDNNEPMSNANQNPLAVRLEYNASPPQRMLNNVQPPPLHHNGRLSGLQISNQQTDNETDNDEDNYGQTNELPLAQEACECSREINKLKINSNQNLINHHQQTKQAKQICKPQSQEACERVQPQIDMITKDFEKIDIQKSTIRKRKRKNKNKKINN